MNSTSPEPLIVTIRSSVTLTSTAPEPSTPEGREGNWLKTVPGKGWFCLLRLYGPEQSFFDGTWNPATSSRAPEPKDPAHNRLGGMMWAVWPASCQAARRRLV